MAILRMYGDLPPDLEVELYRLTTGEEVRWAGRSSGVIEKFQGWALFGVGALASLLNLGGPAAALGLLIDFVQRGRAPDPALLPVIASGLLFFIVGAAMAAVGWRFVKAADRVVWAITNKRLWRVVAGAKPSARSWTKNQILKVDRLNWTDDEKRGLTVTVKGRGQNNPVLIIIGPADLEAAELALAEMED